MRNRPGVKGFVVTPLSERFWPKVRKTRACWTWTGCLTTAGYGDIGLPGRPYRHAPAHRVSWELHRGPIPTGKCVLHRCDNRRCVNPSHLFVGSKTDNSIDKCAKRRQWRPAFDDSRVREVRALYATGAFTTRELADLYGIAHSWIWRVATGQGWRHV